MPPVNLTVGKPKYRDDARSARQAFRDIFHHAEHLRAGQPKITGLFSLIDDNLDVREQLGRVLYLVDQSRRRVTLQEQLRICPCQRPERRIIKRNPLALRFGHLVQKRGFPHLPRAGQKQHGKGAAHIADNALNRSIIVHKLTCLCKSKLLS